MTIDTKAIRAAAEAATPEPWIQSGAGNMPFICMMTPATVIALLDRLEAAEKDAARYRWLTDDHADHETRLMASTIGQYIALRGKGSTDIAIDTAMNN